MKLLTINFEDTVDIGSLSPGTEIEVILDAETATAKVVAITTMEDPPTLEGDYHIEPLQEKEEAEPE